MVYILLFIILAVFIRSYLRFRGKMKYFTAMTYLLQQQLLLNSTPEVLLSLSSALIEIQKYKDAWTVYNQLLKNGYSGNFRNHIQQNMEFCKHPIPGINVQKNFNGSYWMNFLLIRLGNRRYSFLTEQDHLMTQAFFRQKR